MSAPGITLYFCISSEIEGYVRDLECKILNLRTWGYQCVPKMTRQFLKPADSGERTYDRKVYTETFLRDFKFPGRITKGLDISSHD